MFRGIYGVYTCITRVYIGAYMVMKVYKMCIKLYKMCIKGVIKGV